MKIVHVKYNETVVSLFVSEDAKKYIESLEDGFLDDKDECTLLEMLFPGTLEYIVQNCKAQLAWSRIMDQYQENHQKG